MSGPEPISTSVFWTPPRMNELSRVALTFARHSVPNMLSPLTPQIGPWCQVRLTPARQVRTRPWWDARYFIPMLGMMLGSCVSAVSIGLTNLLAEVTNGALMPAPSPEPVPRYWTLASAHAPDVAPAQT